MNSKKNLIIGGIVIVVLVAGAFLWKGGSPKQGAGTEQPGIEGLVKEQISEQMGGSGKMTDEIFIEIMRETAKVVAVQKGMTEEERAKLELKILSKYGISAETAVEYYNALNNDAIRNAALEEKSQQIIKEFQIENYQY
ncbi:MAG: hypothetical protein Q7S81_02260 [bacterium]|nr:hypothetical protein [bacterium]